ncbi:flagella synthesis protein FlgN [Shewanella gelidii]|uniref:Flagellar protein FlgN n=1 Tax=Shewanella gelidii TaxID=1642821 RepID=A0A917JJU9_9GAMM|nr:flagellar export chaperone FlgN [Shewanella gelidii]MCL1096491.1 flagellar export chaperone FlgN [Shewanella gelidii]GGI67725.1 flagellar protein FlgN [Shewanella gelidii]
MTNIENLVDNQTNLLLNLKEIIEQEKQALVAQDADTLLSLASQKAALLQQLQINDQAIANQPDIAQAKSNPVIQEKIRIAEQQLADCQTLNAQNADLIDLNMASINRFSQALQASRSSSTMTYDEKGKTTSSATLGNNIKA